MSDKIVTAPFTALGAGGTVVYGGYVQENEKDKRLTGSKKYITYADLLANTSIISAGVRYFMNIVSKPSWHVESADDSDEAKWYADIFESMLYDMRTPWFKAVRRASMYRFYGFSVQEWTAKVRKDGYIGFDDIATRPQSTIERWDVDCNGGVVGIIQRSPQTYQEIYLPRRKCVYIVDDTINDSPEGLGLFRHVVKPATQLSRFEQLEGFGYETDLRGIPIARMPLAAIEEMVTSNKITAEQAESMKRPLLDFLNNHVRGPRMGMLLDSTTYRTEDASGSPSSVPLWDVQLLDGGTVHVAEVAAAINRKQLEIARILGVENLLLGADGSGSLALSRDKSYNFYLLVEATLNELVESFEHDIVDPVWMLNGWPENMKPGLKTDALRFRDVEQITAALRDLATAGAMITPEDPVVNEVRDHLGLSHTETNTDGVTPPIAEGEVPDSLLSEAGLDPVNYGA